MENFWDYNVWGILHVFAALLLALTLANVLKKHLRFLRESLIPTSVLGGLILLVITTTYKAITGNVLFDCVVFGAGGAAQLEIITYHALAIGFIASSLKTSETKMTKQRSVEIFNTGVTTVSTYLLQALVGMLITVLAAVILSDFFAASGILLPFAYGQGTGQALNYGNIFEMEHGFIGGKNFGLTLAALGFLSASIGGVIHFNLLKRRGQLKIRPVSNLSKTKTLIDVENGSMDKFTAQVALIASAYLIAYLLMFGLGALLPGMKSVIYGFNFLLGVLSGALVKSIVKLFEKKTKAKHSCVNNYLLSRISNFAFDVMVVAGIAAIRLDLLKEYWAILLILGVIGALITYIYLRFVSKKLFPDYAEEQFVAMYGMLTGTASTGIILLREIDADFTTPVADNLVYQNFPAIVFGFPIMLLVTAAPTHLWPVFGALFVFFVVMNILLFRSRIFKRKK